MSIEKGVDQERQQPETAPNFAILNQRAFYYDFIQEAEKAFATALPSQQAMQRSRIWARAMVVEYGYTTRDVFQTLEKAARLGFDTRLYLDPFSDYVPQGSLRFIPTFSKDRPLLRKINQRRFEQLRESGVDVQYTNPQTKLKEKIMFMTGRSHKKMAVVSSEGRQVAWIGGMNFWDAHSDYIDYMVKLTNPRIVAAIIDEFPRINENRRTEDEEINCTEDTSLLIDCGKRGESIILDRAIQEVKDAQKKIVCISELVPEGKFLHALTQAHKRGVEITFMTNNPSKAGVELRAKHMVERLTFKYKKPEFAIIFPELGIHAKLLIVDDQNVIVGSNNFSPTSVNYGTEEAALFSTNPILVANAMRYDHLTTTHDRTK